MVIKMINKTGDRFTDTDSNLIVTFNNTDIDKIEKHLPEIYETVRIKQDETNRHEVDFTLFKGGDKYLGELVANEDDFKEYSDALIALALTMKVALLKTAALPKPLSLIDEKLHEIERIEQEYGITVELWD